MSTTGAPRSRVNPGYRIKIDYALCLISIPHYGADLHHATMGFAWAFPARTRAKSTCLLVTEVVGAMAHRRKLDWCSETDGRLAAQKAPVGISDRLPINSDFGPLGQQRFRCRRRGIAACSQSPCGRAGSRCRFLHQPRCEVERERSDARSHRHQHHRLIADFVRLSRGPHARSSGHLAAAPTRNSPDLCP